MHGALSELDHGDRFAYVTRTVGIAVKGGYVPMTFQVIFVKQGERWTWVSLDFAPPLPE